MRTFAILIAITFTFLWAGALTAQTPATPQEDEVLRGLRSLYGVQPIEELAVAGAQIRRAFFIDGFDNDLAAISFERKPGADPRVVVTVLVDKGGKDSRRVEMAAPIPLRAWEGVLRETRLFDRTLAPPPPVVPDDGIRRICLHPWLVAVEATDPDTRPATRRKTDGTCDDSLASEAAFAMAQRAYELLPHCNALSLEQYRNAAPLLSFCALLEGDRLAAAEAMNQSGKIDRIFGDPRPEELTSLVCAEATLQWPGEAPARGSEGAAEYRKRHQSEIWGTHIARVIGENVNRVRITGRLSKRLKDSESIETAPFEQIWMREDRNFCLREMRVEPFAPAAAK